jgi:hypothetical protein
MNSADNSMNRLLHFNAALIISLLGLSTLAASTIATAQETKTDIADEHDKVCSYLQYEPKSGDLFNRDKMLPITTVWFEDTSCMEDTEKNRLKIIDSIARSYGHEGTDFENNQPKVSRQNAHGDCYELPEDSSVALNIYYIFDTEFIQGFVHAQPKDGICVEAAGRGAGGPGGGRPGGNG